MIIPDSSNEQISIDALYSFYSHAVLPEFGFTEGKDINWINSRCIEADEFAHTLTINSMPHILIWEDYEGIGSNQEFVTTHVCNGAKFEYIIPVSQTDISPSYDGFRLDSPSQYCENVTGTFTLIKLL